VQSQRSDPARFTFFCAERFQLNTSGDQGAPTGGLVDPASLMTDNHGEQNEGEK
jgi:hypothetical protein